MALKAVSIIPMSIAALLVAAPLAFAENHIDCEDEANKDEADCIAAVLGNDPVTNLVPIVSVLGGAAVFGAIAGSGGSGGGSTPSTPNTPTGN